MARPSTLSAPPTELVLSALRKHNAPMTAYDLLARLKKFGIKSPPIIYRALASLMESGTVHKIKAIGAFVACNCEADHNHPLSVLTVCSQCQAVRELHDHAVIRHLSRLKKLGVALPPHAVVELPVVCSSCA